VSSVTEKYRAALHCHVGKRDIQKLPWAVWRTR